MTNPHQTRIEIGHGSGGLMGRRLVSDLIVRVFGQQNPNGMDDACRLELGSSRIAFTTDSFVVSPLFFPGGNIGDLAVNGTVNDLLTTGGTPLALSCAFILEEGLLFADFEKVVHAMKDAAGRAGVKIVTGDTKVVERGKADRMFINTSGIAILDSACQPACDRIQPGDAVIVSGSIGDHGMAVMAMRESLSLESAPVSDTAALTGLVRAALKAGGENVHAMRDPTRGGVAAALNELAQSSGVEIELDEISLPVRRPVAGICELLGIDPLHVANEGKMLIVTTAPSADAVLEAVQSDPLGRDARIIGRVVGKHRGLLCLRTALGASRIITQPVSDPLPRIC